MCKLKKYLYGLKQFQRHSYKRFDSFMLTIGYESGVKDLCVYVRILEDGSQVYLLLYVDDMLIASCNKSEVSKLRLKLGREFDMKDLGATKKNQSM